MSPKKAEILKLEIWGGLFIVFLGSLLHFTFAWLGRFWLVGIFSSVNESVWEHLKLAVFPATFWFLVEKFWLKKEAPNFVLAKIAGIFLMPALIVAIFYAYTAVLGRNILVLDILSFVVAVVIGQILTLRILFLPPVKKNYSWIAVGFLIILLLCFGIFTFWPPKIFLFKDPVRGLFGTAASKETKKVCFGSRCFKVELARTRKEQERGLMFRKELAEDGGMLFVFEEEGIYPFWMKNTLIPLDIIWLDKKGRVVFVSRDTQPCEKEKPCVAIFPPKQAKFVLEIKGGMAANIGLEVGEEMREEN